MTDDAAAGHLVSGGCDGSIAADVGFGLVEDYIPATVQVGGGEWPELVGSNDVAGFPVAIRAGKGIGHTGQVALVEVGCSCVGTTVGVVRITERIAAAMAVVAGGDRCGTCPDLAAGHADEDRRSGTIRIAVGVAVGGTGAGAESITGPVCTSAGVIQRRIDVLALVGNGEVICIGDGRSMTVNAVEGVAATKHLVG